MKRISLVIVFFCLVSSGIPAQTDNTPPRIIRTTLEFGDCNVDTNLTQIQIEFDQDMKPGYSIINSPNMLPIDGKPVWTTPRIFTINVHLKPGRFYQAYMNSDKYHNFTSVDGVPMNSTCFMFHTVRHDDTIQIDTTLNRLKFEEFRNHFLENYSYKVLRGIDWENQFKTGKDAVITSRSETEYGIQLLKILRAANDMHLRIKFNNQNYYSADKRIIPVSSNLNAIFNQLTNPQISVNKIVFAGEISDAGYVNIRSLSSQYEQDISLALDMVKEYEEKPNLIFDLRGNGGGNDNLATKVISYLISEPIQFEKIVIRNELTGLFDSTIVREVLPSGTSIKYNGYIYVMIDGNVMSSAESFVLMFKQLNNVKLVGSTTYGSSGNPKEYVISDSVSVFIPSWQAYDMDGNLIEGNGILPDVRLAFSEEQFNNSDPVFEYLINEISNSGTNFLSTNTNNIIIYPNPVISTLHIHYLFPRSDKIKIQLFDIQGKIIFDNYLPSKGADNFYQEIDLSQYQLKPGVFLIKLLQNDFMMVEKFLYKP